MTKWKPGVRGSCDKWIAGVPGDREVRKASGSFTRVLQDYDGLNGKVIQWTFRHGNTNHDPGILAWVLDPDGEELGRPGNKLHSASGFTSWLKEMSRASFPLFEPASRCSRPSGALAT